MKGFVLLLAKYAFYLYAWFWCLERRRVETTVDVLNLFYLDFLRLNRRDVEVLKLDEHELVTRCRNRCPILNLSLRLWVDTKLACKVVSEPVCRYVLRNVNPRLIFERNYNYIRPYAESCEERIYFRC